MAKLKITKGYQSFSVTPVDIDFMDFLDGLYPVLKEFSLYRLIKDNRTKRIKTQLDKTFYIIDSRNNKVILVNTYFSKFINLVKNRYELDIKEEKGYIPDKLKNIRINEKFKPRDYQEIYIDSIVNAKVPRVLVDLQTGMGKSLIATISLVKKGTKFAILILPRYIEKWIGDLKEYTNIKEKEIFVVKGSDSIRYLALASEKELSKYKVYILSLTTMREYMSNYLDINSEFKYLLEPSEFVRKIKAETILSDETHQEFHNIFKLTTLLNPKFMLGLTATLISNNKRERNIQNYFFPDNYRLSGIIEYQKYIEVYPISYEVANPYVLKAENKYGYSHTKFEDKLRKRKITLDNYLNMIYFTTGAFYLKYRKPGDKCLIFASTIEMCKLIRDYLRKKIKGLTINKYTAEDDFSIIEKSDIIVSTLGSAGTALDIRNLITVVQTVLVKSPTSNIQSLGRLRRLKDKNVRFVYLYSSNIPKHREYHRERLGLFRDRVKSILNLKYDKTV